jgi:nucleoside-diphosphate-sugar epimerase
MPSPSSRSVPPETVFVTGGTGFVGSHLVEELLRRGVETVRCLVRSDPKWLADLDVEVVRGDLSDAETLWTALDGVGTVYHVAGITRAEEMATFERVNVQGTLNLMGAVKHAAPDLERVLVTSSLAAVGRCEQEMATEDVPLRPVSRYGRSKAQMEAALRDPHEMTTSYAEALPLTIVRPPAVYGPRDRDILDFFRAVQQHVCPVVGWGSEPAVSLIHVRDLVRGMVDLATAPTAVGNTYFLSSNAPYAWNDVKAAATEALGTWAVTVPVPGPLVGAVGAAAEGWGRLTGSYPPLNRDKTREIRFGCTMCSHEKAAAAIGFEQQIPLDEGIRTTIDWYRTHGWL